MNQPQTYMGSSCYVGWMRGTFERDKYLLDTYVTLEILALKKNSVTTKIRYKQNKSGFTNCVNCIQLHRYEYVYNHGYDYCDLEFLLYY